jgi:hypothetical protein
VPVQAPVCPPPEPLPDKLTIVGEFEALLEKVNPLVSVTVPVVRGEKETCTVKLFPESNVVGSATLAALNGCWTLILLMVTEPSLAVTTTVCGWLVDPTETVPKLRLEVPTPKVELGGGGVLWALYPPHPL